jgi:hypothetical protein
MAPRSYEVFLRQPNRLAMPVKTARPTGMAPSREMAFRVFLLVRISVSRGRLR